MKLDATFIFSTFSTCMLIFLTAGFMSGQTGLGLSYSSFCLLCSSLWLLKMAAELDDLLNNYIDTRKQRRLKITIAFGTAAALLSFAPDSAPVQVAAALGVLYSWVMVTLAAINTRRTYRKVGRGLVPRDTWLDPPSDAFQPGDVIGTTGIWWEPHHQAFAHCELVVKVSADTALVSNKAMSEEEWTRYTKENDGDLLLASSCSMEYGTYLHSCEDVVQNCRRQTHLREGHERWFCARLTAAGKRDLKEVCGENWQELLSELLVAKTLRNKFARRVETQRRQKLIDAIPGLSPAHKERLRALVRASGYNWCKMIFSETEELVRCLRKVAPGLTWVIFGDTTSDESDLCSTHVISTLLEDLKLNGKAKKGYRRSFTPFGFFNPVLPVELILLRSANGEPYFRLLDDDDRCQYTSKKLRSTVKNNLHVLSMTATCPSNDIAS